MTARKFLDRSRTLRLDGRPSQVDWELLLSVGVAAVERGYATEPWLESTMWTGVAPRGRFSRPVLFDFPLLRQWLDVEPANAMAYMRAGFGFMEAPRTVKEALEMLAWGDCYSAGLTTHRLTHAQATYMVVTGEDTGEWVVGSCRDCLQAVLCFFPTDDGEIREWPFYNQTIETSVH